MSFFDRIASAGFAPIREIMRSEAVLTRDATDYDLEGVFSFEVAAAIDGDREIIVQQPTFVVETSTLPDAVGKTRDSIVVDGATYEVIDHQKDDLTTKLFLRLNAP